MSDLGIVVALVTTYFVMGYSVAVMFNKNHRHGAPTIIVILLWPFVLLVYSVLEAFENE